MRTSKYLFSTLKNKSINNSNNKIQNLMIRLGLIRKISSGIYTLMPTGFKIIDKINKIIKNEFNKIDAMEILIPILQPINIWYEKHKQLDNLELFNCYSKGKKSFILSATNEKIISYILKKEIKSSKQLPLILFQIQNKFRDEIRCKNFIRTKEFIMKDAYSFHENKNSLIETYEKICFIYKKIFNIFNLNFYINKSYSTLINDNSSHEFNVISKYGENKILICSKTNKSGNSEIINNIYNKNINYFLNIKDKFKINNINNNNKDFYINNKIKVYIFYANIKIISSKYIALAIKNNDNLSKFKLNNLIYLKKPIKIASEKEIYLLTKTNINFIGIININIPIIIDYNLSYINNFITGANINNKFFSGVNWYRDIKMPIIEDIVEIKNLNISVYNKNGILKLNNSIEIAHIFQLDNKYSEKIKFNIKNKYNISNNVFMGCYGIGISRLLFTIVEQNLFNNKIIWPANLHPFDVALIPINLFKNINVKTFSYKIYYLLINNNIDVLFEDRTKYLGEIFNEIELIGIPNILIINEKNTKNKEVEFINKVKNIKLIIKEKDIIKYIKNI